jgi:hypothetical protein
MSFCQVWERETMKAFAKGEGEVTVSIDRVIGLSCTWPWLAPRMQWRVD